MGSVVCVRRGLLLVGLGENRESARRGARGFLISYFSIFLRLKFQPFNYRCFAFPFCFSRDFFIGLVVCITLTGMKRETAIKSVNIFGICMGIFRMWILDFFGRKILGI